MKRAALLVALLLFASEVHAACTNNGGGSWTAASASETDVEACITAASSGNTIHVPAGSASWTNVVINKSIQLIGNGIGSTIITDTSSVGNSAGNRYLTVTSGFDNVRVSGFTFNSDSTAGQLQLWGSFLMQGMGWRIDHNDFDNNTSDNGYAITVEGRGVIDSNAFGHRAAIGVYGDYSTDWGNASSIGGSSNVFIEGNTFTWTNTFGDGNWDCYSGGHVVTRFNTIINTQYGVHGNDSGSGALEGGCRSWESYNDLFTNDGSSIFAVMNFRGGTGVVYNTVVTVSGAGNYSSFILLQNYRSEDGYGGIHGDCNGGSSADQNTPGGEGYACLEQVGRGQNQALEAAYEWNNTFKGADGDFGVDTSQGSRVYTYHIFENRDFYNDTTKPGYSAYTCPNPITGYTGTCDSGTAGVAGYNVSSSCTPAKLLFSAQPSNAVIGATLGTVSVGVYDSGDVLCTDDSTTSITLSENGSSTWGTLASGSNLTKTVLSGVATWTDLSVTGSAGSGSIDASDGGALTDATSNSITISQFAFGAARGRLHR